MFSRFEALRLALAHVYLLLPACGPVLDAPQIGRLEASVTVGATTDGFPSVGQLVVQRRDASRSDCSGNLIAERTVLTARHCVTDLAQADFVIDGRRFEVTAVHTPPRARREAAQPVVDQPVVDQHLVDQHLVDQHLVDLALVELDRAPGLAATPIALHAPRIGTPVRIVGLGTTQVDRTDAGIKREGANVVADVTAKHLVFLGDASRSGFCDGDSGGPSFASVHGRYVQVGVHSAGGRQCGVRDYDERLDRHAEWLLANAAGRVDTVDVAPGSVCNSDSPDRLAEECVPAACSASAARAPLPIVMVTLLLLGIRRVLVPSPVRPLTRAALRPDSSQQA